MKFRGHKALELAASAAVFDITSKSHGQNQSKLSRKRALEWRGAVFALLKYGEVKMKPN